MRLFLNSHFSFDILPQIKIYPSHYVEFLCKFIFVYIFTIVSREITKNELTKLAVNRLIG